MEVVSKCRHPCTGHEDISHTVFKSVFTCIYSHGHHVSYCEGCLFWSYALHSELKHGNFLGENLKPSKIIMPIIRTKFDVAIKLHLRIKNYYYTKVMKVLPINSSFLVSM